MLKNLFAGLLVTILLLPFLANSAAAQQNVTLHFFYSDFCPHCAKERVFLDKLEDKYKQLEVKSYEVSGSLENQLTFKSMGDKLGADTSGVPFTVIGERYFIGYAGDQITGAAIEKEINKILSESSSDQDAPGEINLPVFGSLDLKSVSLPALTIIIAFLDGFNPCAMWVLLFLISLLLGMKNKKKMWLLGGAFIFTSGLVYFLFLATWLNLFLFIGFVSWVRIIIGVIAIAAASYYLWDFFKNKGVCKTIGSSFKNKVFDRLKKIVAEKHIAVALVGIVALAASVNVVELVCSAGLPAVFTEVLTLSSLPVWQYYMYLVIYIIIFMIDDLFVFVVAMLTLQATGISTKYSKLSRIIGAVVLFIIGILMLFKPELLMFA